MESITSKEKILKSIREALVDSTPQPFPGNDPEAPIYQDNNDSLDILFAKQFNAVDGQFIFCENSAHLSENIIMLLDKRKWKDVYCWDEKLLSLVQYNAPIESLRTDTKMKNVDAGITFCESLLARTGSIMVSSRQASGRSLTIYPPVHLVVAYVSQLVYDIEDAIKLIQERYENNFPSMVSLITGPSRTADIEKTLVLGAHGPKELMVFLIDEEEG